MDNMDKTFENGYYEIGDYQKKIVSEIMKSLKPGEVIVCSFGQGGGAFSHRYFKDKYVAPSVDEVKTEEEKQKEERLRSGSWNISNHFDSQKESPLLIYEEQPKITKEQFDQLKPRLNLAFSPSKKQGISIVGGISSSSLNSQKTEDATLSRIESFRKKLYETRKSVQLEEWVKGNPIHNVIDDECCPDFSCCQPELLRSESERIEYASLDDNCRENWRKLFGLRAIIACVK